jgi:hypothetical protein
MILCCACALRALSAPAGPENDFAPIKRSSEQGADLKFIFDMELVAKSFLTFCCSVGIT